MQNDGNVALKRVDRSSFRSDKPSTSPEIAALHEDLRRYGPRAFLREPSIYAVLVYRLGRWNDSRPAGLTRALGRFLYLVAYMAVRTSSGIEIPKEAEIGPGLRIYHQGPVVIHPAARAGRALTLRHGVTIGERRRGAGVPTLGDDVELGSYAQVLGPITVASRTRIGSLALVISDVPEGAVVTATPGTVRTQSVPGERS